MADWITGIDVSVHQGPINWSAVQQAGIGYTFLKASEGTGFTDPRWQVNRSGATNAGIPWGGYHFARPDSAPDDARAEARWFISRGVLDGQIPPALDLESTTMDRERTIQWAADFCDELERAGGPRAYILYSGAFFMGPAIAADPRLRHCRWWLPNYGSGTHNPDPHSLALPSVNNGVGEGWDFWQYSARGAVAGIPTDCDMNVVERAVLAQMIETPSEEDMPLTQDDINRVVDALVPHFAGAREAIGGWIQGERGYNGETLVGLADGGVYVVFRANDGEQRRKHVASPAEVSMAQATYLAKPVVFAEVDSVWGSPLPRPGLAPLSKADADFVRTLPLAGPDPHLSDAEKTALATAIIDGIATRGVPVTLTPGGLDAVADAVADEDHRRSEA